MNLYKVTSSKLKGNAVRVDYVNAHDYDEAAIKLTTLYDHERLIRNIILVD